MITHGKHSGQHHMRLFLNEMRFFVLCLILTSEIRSTASGVVAVTVANFTPGPGVRVLGHSAATQPDHAELWSVLYYSGDRTF